ncbi:MAG: hypothetical protein SOV62_06775 [Alloprevotella sp.]|nr:hypothetical protein [Alloprevotella sp.]
MSERLQKAYTLLLLVCFALTGAQAQTTPAELKGLYERVRSLNDIHSGDLCLIVGTIVPFGENTNANRRPYMLTSKVDDGKWLEAEMTETDVENGTAMTAAKEHCLWQVAYEDGIISLKSLDTDLWLSPGTASLGSTSLVATAEAPYAWHITEAADARFYIQNKDNNRWLTLYREQSSHFGCYSNVTPTDCHTLIIYKYLSDENLQGTAQLPEDGSNVVLANGTLLMGPSLEAVNVAETLLSDGTTAQTETLQPWRVQHRADSCFVLQKTDGTYLGYDFRHSATEALWRITQGKITTVESTPRSLYFSPSGTLTLNASETTDNALTFVTAAPPAQTSTSSDGTTTLRGGWTAKALEQADWSATTTLDLTAIAMPVRSFTFVNRPTDRHTFILVSEADAERIPLSWPFVAAADGERFRLLTPSVIQDRQAFVVPVDISYTASQVSYSRQAFADGGWETLCLPFATTIPNDFSAQKFEALHADTLSFSPVINIPAHTPVIIRYAHTPSNGTTTLSLQATQDGTFKARQTQSGDTPFIGIYEPFVVDDSGTPATYLLTPTGSAFVKAAAQSRLAPFRARLAWPTSASTPRLIHRP